MESRKATDERRGIQFRGNQLVCVFSSYWRFDAAFSTLTVEPGGGGLSFYPDIPWQHTSGFCKTFSVLIRRYVRYECIKLAKRGKYCCYYQKYLLFYTPSSLKYWLAPCWKYHFWVSTFQNFLGGMPPDPPRGSRLRRSYLITPLNKYCCQYEHPSKNLSYGHASDGR